MEPINQEKLTTGQKLSDFIVKLFSGWPFVFVLGVTITCWIFYNYLGGPDPYPFILLNLILSFLAAFENTVILMSSKRLERLDRAVAHRNLELSLQSDTMLKDVVGFLEREHKFDDELMNKLASYAEKTGVKL